MPMEVQFLLLPGQLDMSDGTGRPLHISLREPHWNLFQGHHGTTLKSPLICPGDLHQHLAALQPSLPLYHRAPPLVDPVPEGQDDQGGPVKLENFSSWEDFSSCRPMSRWAALSRRRRGAESVGQTPTPWSLLGPLSQR